MGPGVPTHTEHHTFGADRRGHFLGFEDDIGHLYHTGAATFVKIKYEWATGDGAKKTARRRASEASSRLYLPDLGPSQKGPYYHGIAI